MCVCDVCIYGEGKGGGISIWREEGGGGGDELLCGSLCFDLMICTVVIVFSCNAVFDCLIVRVFCVSG